jgi:hypothetical protein
MSELLYEYNRVYEVSPVFVEILINSEKSYKWCGNINRIHHKAHDNWIVEYWLDWKNNIDQCVRNNKQTSLISPDVPIVSFLIL